MFRCKCDLNLLKIIHRVITSMLKDRMDAFKLLENTGQVFTESF